MFIALSERRSYFETVDLGVDTEELGEEGGSGSSSCEVCWFFISILGLMLVSMILIFFFLAAEDCTIVLVRQLGVGVLRMTEFLNLVYNTYFLPLLIARLLWKLSLPFNIDSFWLTGVTPV